jgi:CheY-like chemotaxis protein/anti-sigma regulatory factor (Ser/Thr protein kinase)
VKSLEEASVAKTRFFAAANHDLRQPLHAMGLLLHTMPPESLEMPHRETVQRLSHCIDGMSEVVDGLLEMARLDSGQWAPQWTVFDADAAIQECCKPYEAAARSKGLGFSTDTAVAYVRTDRSLFMRALSNLVANAIRYTPKGWVRITANATAGQLHVSVEDSGIGIEAEHLPRIFEEFYQAGNASRDRRQGLGLGLATVKRLSDLLALSVEVRSSPGIGSVFSLKLPVASIDDSAPASTANQEDSLVSVRPVLVIEDDPDSRSALVALLGSWGCVAQGAASVPDALALLDDGFRPEAAVVDFRLPDNATGADAVRMLRERIAPDFPAVIVTGDAGIADQLRENGLTVMVKPVRPMQLRAFLSQSFTRATAGR